MCFICKLDFYTLISTYCVIIWIDIINIFLIIIFLMVFVYKNDILLSFNRFIFFQYCEKMTVIEIILSLLYTILVEIILLGV